MFDGLQIYDPRERALVGLADLALTPLRWIPRGGTSGAPARILLLRLERIGDLLMTRDVISAARTAWPEAEIDLVVGSWNAPLARWVRGPSRVDTLDVPWLAREGSGQSWPAMLTHARGWAARRYDLVINFEPDLRSNLLAWMSGAPRRLGYWTGGGGAWLTEALAYEPSRHVAENAWRLLVHAAPALSAHLPRPHVLEPDGDAVAAAGTALASAPAGGPLVGLHVAGGRPSKQWHLDRFAAVGRALASDGATLVLTGAAADRAVVERVRSGLGDAPVIDLAGPLPITTTAAVLARLHVLVTGDTGPMHLAAAVGTPVVALFGPSDPRRYGPLGTDHQVLRVDLPCSPCGQVRLPPVRCRGKVPDCLDGITVERVVAAARTVLRART